jgi:hypothetical protein
MLTPSPGAFADEVTQGTTPGRGTDQGYGTRGE